MIMKLQNNFTTLEQIKRLLELGVPADSADFYFDRDEVEIDEVVQPYFIPFNRKFSNYDERFYIPCWSVGRLIEIFNICANGYFTYIKTTDDMPLIKQVLSRYEHECKIVGMDFSKLGD